jgi:ABC-2 type transport system permease protein
MEQTTIPTPPGALRRPVNQPLLFQWLRWRRLSNSWRVLLGQGSVRPLTILLCSLIVWLFVFAISYGGFHFLEHEVRVPLIGGIVARLFDLLFLALGVFLVFSSGLILYGSLFASAETDFLLSKPVAADQVFAYKYQGAVAFSSWAFLLLGSPVLIAYGLVCASPWYFYLFLPFFFLGFVLLPSCVGSIICLLLINFVPRHRKQVMIVAIVIGVALFGLWTWSVLLQRQGKLVDREAVNRLLDRFSFASSVLLPSHWVASGLGDAGKSRVREAFYYLALVWSNGLFLYVLTAWLARHLYRRGFNRVATGGTLRKRYGGGWLDRLVGFGLPFVSPSTRLLLVKDFRTFRRDPQQWAQVLIFSGLMLLYIINVRKMFVGDIRWAYQNTISLLNLCAVALLLCTYTGRFVYPLLSLEGRKFWVLGLLPLKREQLLWGKFAFSTAGTLFMSALLIVVSDLILDMPAMAMLLHLVTVLVLSTGLSGMSVGLGAMMPNFRETDPSKIAVGFGGTLNLVACLLFLILILTTLAAPWHLQMAAADGGESPLPAPGLVAVGAIAGLALGLLAVVVPLHLGIQALRRMEF